MGNPVEMVYPDSSKITQEYDIASRLSKFFNKRGQEIDYTYDLHNVPRGDSITNCLVKPRQSDANDRERINEITGGDFHYLYKHGHLGGMGSPRGIASLDASQGLGIMMLTMWQQEELLSGSLLQMVNNAVYGAPINIYDSFGWRKYFLYDAPSLSSSPNEIDYLWKGTQASFMRNG